VRPSAAATSAITSVGKNKRGRSFRTQLKKLLLSALPGSPGRAALTKTLESIVIKRTLASHLLKLSNGGACFLACLFGELLDQRLPSIPGAIDIGLSKQALAGIHRNNRLSNGAVSGAAARNAPAFTSSIIAMLWRGSRSWTCHR
jgi:hypothetical protein